MSADDVEMLGPETARHAGGSSRTAANIDTPATAGAREHRARAQGRRRVKSASASRSPSQSSNTSSSGSQHLHQQRSPPMASADARASPGNGNGSAASPTEQHKRTAFSSFPTRPHWSIRPSSSGGPASPALTAAAPMQAVGQQAPALVVHTAPLQRQRSSTSAISSATPPASAHRTPRSAFNIIFRRGSAPSIHSQDSFDTASTEPKDKLKPTPKPISISRASSMTHLPIGLRQLVSHWSLPTPSVTMPSPSWVGPQHSAASPHSSAAAIFITSGAPLARRSSLIDNWTHLSPNPVAHVPALADRLRRLVDLAPDIGAAFGATLGEVTGLLRVASSTVFQESGISSTDILPRILAALQDLAEALVANSLLVEEGSSIAVCFILFNSQVRVFRHDLANWSSWAGASLARRGSEIQQELTRHQKLLVQSLSTLLDVTTLEATAKAAREGRAMSPHSVDLLARMRHHVRETQGTSLVAADPDAVVDLRSVITSEPGLTFFRHLSRTLRPFLQVKGTHVEDEFRLPSAALSPVPDSAAMSPSRDSFASPPLEATARELVQRLEDLDDVFKNLDFESPSPQRRSAAFSEQDVPVEVDEDSDIDSLNGDESSMLKSPRVGTPQLLSLLDDLISNLDRLAPRALAQKLDRLAAGLNALNHLPSAAVQVASMEVALYRKQSLLETPAGRVDLVNALDNLANALEASGRVEEALPLTEEMLQHVRQLQAQRLPAQGLTLSKLARRLAAVGRYTDALATSEEHTHMYEALHEQDPRRYASDLGAACFSRAAALHLLGRRDSALVTCEQALTLRRRVYQQNVHHHQHARLLAESQLQLSELQVHANEAHSALAAASAAVKVLRSSPSGEHNTCDALATALLVQANRFREQNQLLDALHATRAAVAIYRNLCAHGSETYAGFLARALCRLGHDEASVQKVTPAVPSPLPPAMHPALVIYAEATSCLRPLIADLPVEYSSDLARALLAYASCLSAVGREHESTSAVRESLATLKNLPENMPSHEDDYVKGLIRLCASLSREGTPVEGLAASQELIELQRRRAAIQPEAYQADLARALCNHAFFLDAAGDSGEALQICEESVQVLRAAAVRNDPRATKLDLALAMRQLSGRLRKAGLLQESLAKMQETVELMRSVSERQSGYVVDLALLQGHLGRALRDLATILGLLKRHEQSVIVVKDSVRVFRTLEAMELDAHRVDLARSVNELANRLAEAGHPKQALRSAREAVALWQSINDEEEQASAQQQQQPRLHRPDLAFSTWALARRLSDVEDFGEAAKTIEPAIGIFSELARESPERWQRHLEGALQTQTHLLHEAGHPVRAFSKSRHLKRLKGKSKGDASASAPEPAAAENPASEGPPAATTASAPAPQPSAALTPPQSPPTLKSMFKKMDSPTSTSLEAPSFYTFTSLFPR